jgi:hypothetical protein
MGWKAIKATISGVSIMKQLVPHVETVEGAPDSVFESNIDPTDPGEFVDIRSLPSQPNKGLFMPKLPDKIDEETGIKEPVDELPEVEIPFVEPVKIEPKVKPQVQRSVSISAAEPMRPLGPEQQQTGPGPRNQIHRMMSQVFNRQDKRYPGLGFVQRCMGRARKSRVDSQVKLQLDNWQDHRPFFTWWVSSVQVMVLLVAILRFQIAPFGLEDHKVKTQVQHRFSEKTIYLTQQRNFYFGPETDKLIRLGAKYAPCMRKDKKIFEIIECEWAKEERTACCKYGEYCLQASEDQCKNVFYNFLTYEKYNTDYPSDTRYKGWKSGSVCGLDPNYCDEQHLDTSMIKGGLPFSSIIVSSIIFLIIIFSYTFFCNFKIA